MPNQNDPTPKTELEYLKLDIEIWKKTIDVQQHFNDLELRIRNFAVTLLGVILVASGVALNANQITTVIWLLVAALVAWLAFFFMDKFWYHQLLKGAVQHAHSIENRINNQILSANLSHKISETSKVKIFGIETNSGRRLNIFYLPITILLIIAIIFFSFNRPTNSNTPSSAPTVIPTQTPG